MKSVLSKLKDLLKSKDEEKSEHIVTTLNSLHEEDWTLDEKANRIVSNRCEKKIKTVIHLSKSGSSMQVSLSDYWKLLVLRKELLTNRKAETVFESSYYHLGLLTHLGDCINVSRGKESLNAETLKIKKELKGVNNSRLSITNHLLTLIDSDFSDYELKLTDIIKEQLDKIASNYISFRPKVDSYSIRVLDSDIQDHNLLIYSQPYSHEGYLEIYEYEKTCDL